MKYRTKLMLTILALTVTLMCQGKVYIVSAGITDYPGTQNDLINCARDAKSILDIYKANGPVESRLLTNGQATISNITRALEQVFSKATANDAVVFYYSGHGTPGALYVYDGELKYDVLKRILANTRASRKIVFIDACFSGKMQHTNTSASTTFKSQNVMFFLSSRETETSQDNAYRNNSTFTAFLSRGLRGGADTNKDRIVTAKELFKFVSKGTKRLTNNKQHPQMVGRFKDNMPVISWK